MWHKVRVNIQNIIKKTDKAVLIKLPKSELQFWHPKKLVRQMKDGKGYWYSLTFSDEFKFIAKRYGAKFKILEEKVFSPQEIKKIFGILKWEKEFIKKYHIPQEEHPTTKEVLDELSE